MLPTEAVHAWEQPPAGPSRRASGVLEIRETRAGDHEALLDLWHELMAHHEALDPRFELAAGADQRFALYLETAKSRDDYRVRMATVDGRAAGFYVACVLPNSPVYRARWIGYINDLCVTRSLRRQGVGEALVRDAVRWLQGSGAESVELYVAHNNLVAQRFWRRVGGRDYLQRLALDISRLFPDNNSR